MEPARVKESYPRLWAQAAELVREGRGAIEVIKSLRESEETGLVEAKRVYVAIVEGQRLEDHQGRLLVDMGEIHDYSSADLDRS